MWYSTTVFESLSSSMKLITYNTGGLKGGTENKCSKATSADSGADESQSN